MNHDSADAVAHEVERRATGQRLEVFVGSRQAGHTLTRDCLEAGISLSSLIDVARDVADYADEAIAIVRHEYRPRLDCKEGCSYCCCKPGVLVTIPELIRILDHLQTALDADGIEAVRTRARRYVRQLAGRHFDAPTDESVACPLLSDGRCSVYEIRPLTCRGYNSTSVDACRNAHASSNALVPTFAPIRDVTDGTTVGVATRLREVGFYDSLVDLGTALNIALENDGDFAQALAGGAVALEPARNSSWVDDMWTRVRETARRVGVKMETT